MVDALPQPPSIAAVKGTVVHDVLERLYDLPAAERTVGAAQSMLPSAWEKTLKKQPDAAALFADPEGAAVASADTQELVARYFDVERPQNLNPRAREEFIDARIKSGVLLRGIIDRIDVAPNGAIRVVDYKTGKMPDPRFVQDALFQMRFYALMLRETWKLPKRLQLLYLRSTQVLTLDPEPRDIEMFEEEVDGIWQRIKSDALSGRFAPRKSPLCGWCPFQEFCPSFGGTELDLPPDGVQRLLSVEKPSDKTETNQKGS